eukprot:m.185784 g.185784  ORF g.185784 m.185784 type:complete len:268 (-) comp16574_c0_seq1:146-949(-)
MTVIGDLSAAMAVGALAIPSDSGLVPAEFDGYLPALHLMGATMFFTPGISNTAWRFCGSAFILGYAAKVMIELPHTQHHMTLWLNVMFGISFAISGHTRLLHSVTFVSSHTLAAAYTSLLYFLGHGSLLAGFYTLDVAQYNGDVLKATVHTIILHFFPALMAHAELARFVDEHRAQYAGARESWLSFAWLAVLSPALLPLVYDQIQIAKHGSPEQAMHFNYKVPLEMAPLVLKATWGMLPVVQLGTYRYFANIVMPLEPAPDAKKTE